MATYIKIILIALFCIGSSFLVECFGKINTSFSDIVISYKFLGAWINKSLEYFGVVGIPLFLILSSKEIKQYVDTHYWRTLFFQEDFKTKVFQRKLLEIFWSLIWFNRKVSKEDQLDLYLTSV